MIRPCLRCHTPLYPDQDILADARRREIPLDFLPLRCVHGHTERLPLERPASRVRYLPTCGYCGAPVVERKRRGWGGRLNHAACTVAGGRKANRPREYVAVEVR